MRQTDQQADEAFREQCRRQMDRPLALRIKYGFNRVYKPVLDDAPWRVFKSMAEYRAWCETNLENFQAEWERNHRTELRSASEIAARKSRDAT